MAIQLINLHWITSEIVYIISSSDDLSCTIETCLKEI